MYQYGAYVLTQHLTFNTPHTLQCLRERYNNFNSYLAILSAIESSPVSRLDWPDRIIKVCGRRVIMRFIEEAMLDVVLANVHCSYCGM